MFIQAVLASIGSQILFSKVNFGQKHFVEIQLKLKDHGSKYSICVLNFVSVAMKIQLTRKLLHYTLVPLFQLLMYIFFCPRLQQNPFFQKENSQFQTNFCTPYLLPHHSHHFDITNQFLSLFLYQPQISTIPSIPQFAPICIKIQFTIIIFVNFTHHHSPIPLPNSVYACISVYTFYSIALLPAKLPILTGNKAHLRQKSVFFFISSPHFFNTKQQQPSQQQKSRSFFKEPFIIQLYHQHISLY